MSKKNLLLFIDLGIFVAAYALSYLICIESKDLHYYFGVFFRSLMVAAGIKLIVFYVMGMYQPIWRYASIHAFWLVIKATVLGSCLTIAGYFFLRIFVPRSILIVDGMVTIITVGLLRFFIRVSRDEGWTLLLPSRWNKNKGHEHKQKILIYGAGDAGDMMLREFRSNTQLHNYHVAGFIDDFKPKGSRIHNVPILGTLQNLQKIVIDNQADEIIIAIANLESQKMRQVVSQCRSLNVRYKVIPRLGDIVNDRIQSTQLRDLDISDLLKRPPKNLDQELIRSLIEGKRVLITGAGGSIGSELCYQVARCKPREMIIIEKNEHNLYQVSTKLADQYPGVPLSSHLLSVTNHLRMERIFEEKKPQIIFHAAAYKHVPLCEENICEAVVNNVQGVMTVANIAEKFGCEKFIFISTDKAVKPSSVMGATKRCGEMYVQAKPSTPESHFITVRFGNVLESSGSVVPRFKEQIRAGGPVTVTDPQVTRYLMLLEEAVQLILQAAGMGCGGEVFVLDMGEPIRIVDMARDLISLMGFRPDKDIAIEFSSLRPGEKLHEELFEAEEGIHRIHPSIMCGRPNLPDSPVFLQELERLVWNAYQEDTAATMAIMTRLFPTLKLYAAAKTPLSYEEPSLDQKSFEGQS
ncbi:MAG: polysaccharide biosynthesis protein [Candidatus Omnitrophica bacterium]|nr:polysaccharide biosynthesis protein [Candidatus Omnitrophota bacterium]